MLLLPIVLNAPIVFGFFQSDSMLRYGGLATNVTGGYLPGAPLEDPSMAYTYEPNAELAMTQIVHGEMPWWNPYEATGMPLAGEMQSAAFSPFSPLLFLRNGQAVVNLLVELLAGVGLYLLLRRLRFSEFSSAAAAMTFSVNGSFAWLGAETFYAVAFLPLLLYRLERLRDQPFPRIGRWAWTALLVAVPVTCGFPETVYFDDLFVLAWVMVRAFDMPRSAAKVWIANAAVGGLAGVLLVSPLLIAFFDFLRVSFVGAHGGSFGDQILPHEAILQTFLPYVWGPISVFVNGGPLAQLQQTWPNVGGYLGYATALLAVLAIAGRRLRPLRALTFVWLVVFVSAGFGIPPFHALVAGVPGSRYTSYFRYDPPTWELCAAFLVACSLEDVRSGARRLSLRTVSLVCIASLSFLAYVASSEATIFHELFALTGYAIWPVFCCIVVAAVTAVLLACVLVPNAETRAWLLAAVVVAEAGAYLFIPTLANLRSGTMDLGGVAFLRSNIGLQRVYTMGPMQPNLGSAFSVAQVNYNDAPIPANVYAFVGKSLDPAIYPVLFTGSDVPGPGLPSRLDVLRRNLRNYAAAGVAYVVTMPHVGAETLTLDQQNSNSQPVDVRTNVRLHARTKPVADSGMLTTIAVLQGNYGGTATGTLTARVCARSGCASASRALSSSEDNHYFDLPLDRPLFVGHEPIDIDITSTGSKPDAIWSFADMGGSTMTIESGDARLANRHISVRLRFASFSYTDPFTPSGNVPLPIDPQSPVSVEFGALPSGEIAGASILIGNYARKAEGTMRLSVCASGHCETASRPILESIDNAMLDFHFRRPLKIDGSLSMHIEIEGGRRWPAIWLYPSSPYGSQTVLSSSKPIDGRSIDAAFVYSSGFGLRSVYDDSTLSIYRIPEVHSYFDAVNCDVRARSRLEAEVHCRKPSRLVRLETFMPGWHASIDGRPSAIDPDGPLFQSVRVGAGRSAVRFEFRPPFVEIGYALALMTILVLSVEAAFTKAALHRSEVSSKMP